VIEREAYREVERLRATQLRLIRHRMSFFKKKKKSRPSSQLLALAISSHIGMVPLGFGGRLELDDGSEGVAVESRNQFGLI
jgi:hypothetical protein